MRFYKFCFLALSSVFCIDVATVAQTPTATQTQPAPSNQTASAAAASPTPTAAPAKLSREITKKAQQVGFRAQLSKGAIMFCRNDAAIGTRIGSTRCLTESEFDNYLVQLKVAQDNLQRVGCGGNCNGAKGQTP